MREYRVGHLIAVDKDLSNVVAVISKKDILLYMIRNCPIDSKRSKFVGKPIIEIDIGVYGDAIFQME